ncbi:MAG: RNA polymerase sigma-70 factor [Ginsengibacter sp.]
MISQSTYSDNELLQLIAEGSDEAFTSLYRRYWEELFVTAAKALRDKEGAEDVIQDVFLSVWNRRNELKIEGSLAAYLHTSVRYKAIQYIEKNITRRDYLALLADVSVNFLPPKAVVNLQVKELEQIIESAVKNMPPKMQQAYRLSRQQHLSHKEVAEQMNVSAETVKKHVQHALRLIKSALQYSLILIYLFITNLY